MKTIELNDEEFASLQKWVRKIYEPQKHAAEVAEKYAQTPDGDKLQKCSYWFCKEFEAWLLPRSVWHGEETCKEWLKGYAKLKEFVRKFEIDVA